jgi:hypothetical protein
VVVKDNTAVLYVDPVVMNNTTVGLATGGDHSGYQQRRPKPLVKGDLEPTMMNFFK